MTDSTGHRQQIGDPGTGSGKAAATSTLREDGASRARQDRLSEMRHDLRTPLNAIIGYGEMLLEIAEESKYDNLIGDFGAISSAGNHLFQLVEQLWRSHNRVEAISEALSSGPYLELRSYSEHVIDLCRRVSAKAAASAQLALMTDITKIASAAQRFRKLIIRLADESQDESKAQASSPDAALSTTSSLEEEDSEDDTGNGFLLVVDDNEMNRDLLARHLARDGHRVMIAESGPEALELLKLHSFDLVLLDIMMPEMDGYEVCRQLKADQATRNVPVIFITALGDATDETRGLEAGAVDYITKPIKAPVVKARVRTHLELKRARERLERQNKILVENARLRDDVARMTQHDLKTPLQAILNVPAMLTREPNLTSDQVEMLGIVEESGYRMLDIINSSLDLYKMETGAYQLKPVPVDLLKIVREIRGETRELIRSKRLSVDVAVRSSSGRDTNTFMVYGEEMLCYSMLSNLIKNAVEASPEGGRISVTLNKRGVRGQPEIFIHNEGAVPEAIRSRFFEKYATFGKKGGTGLGTYTARLLALTMGGNIMFESSRNSGTTLMVELQGAPPKVSAQKAFPAQHWPDPPAPANEQATPEATPKADRNADSILIVDDYQYMLRTIKGMLLKLGFTNIFTAQSGAAAKNILNKEKIGLVISDWNMPGMSGLELLKYIRSKENWKGLPFIMITGEAQAENILEAKSAGVSEYVVKPFSANTLSNKLSKLLNDLE